MTEEVKQTKSVLDHLEQTAAFLKNLLPLQQCYVCRQIATKDTIESFYRCQCLHAWACGQECETKLKQDEKHKKWCPQFQKLLKIPGYGIRLPVSKTIHQWILNCGRRWLLPKNLPRNHMKPLPGVLILSTDEPRGITATVQQCTDITTHTTYYLIMVSHMEMDLGHQGNDNGQEYYFQLTRQRQLYKHFLPVVFLRNATQDQQTMTMHLLRNCDV